MEQLMSSCRIQTRPRGQGSDVFCGREVLAYVLLRLASHVHNFPTTKQSGRSCCRSWDVGEAIGVEDLAVEERHFWQETLEG